MSFLLTTFKTQNPKPTTPITSLELAITLLNFRLLRTVRAAAPATDTENKNVLRRPSRAAMFFGRRPRFAPAVTSRDFENHATQRSGSAAKTRHNREVTPNAQSHRPADTNLLDLFVLVSPMKHN